MKIEIKKEKITEKIHSWTSFKKLGTKFILVGIHELSENSVPFILFISSHFLMGDQTGNWTINGKHNLFWLVLEKHLSLFNSHADGLFTRRHKTGNGEHFSSTSGKQHFVCTIDRLDQHRRKTYQHWDNY